MNEIFTLKKSLKSASSAFICVLILFLLAACSGGDGDTPTSPPTPTPIPTPIVPEKPTYTVEQGTVVRTLEFTGRVSPVVEQELFFKTDGFVGTVNVSRGDQVTAGQVLAELEIGDLQNQLAQAQVVLETAEITLQQAEQDRLDALAEAQISLEKIQIQITQTQVTGGTADRVGAEIDLENAQQHLADAQYELQKSLDREWEPEEDRQRYEAGVEAAEEALAVAQARYNDVLSGGSSSYYDRQILQQELALAQLKIEQLERGVDPLLALDAEKAQLEIEEIERQMADARLVAPFEGQILSVDIRSGDSATAFEVVIVLADMSALEITADLSADQLGEMSIGQIATVQLRNRPEETFAASVRTLPYPYGGGTVDTGSSDTTARITLNDATTALELGELATVTIILEEKENTLWLPPAALRTFQGRDFVVVQEGSGQRRVDVRLGIESEERVEILEGVEAGQIIVGE